MRYLILILSILFFIDLAHAGNAWFCTSTSTEKNGNTYMSCGVASGADEGDARANALIVAKTEFKSVCSGSADCEGRAVNISPERTQCNKTEAGFTCYRAVTFTVVGDQGSATKQDFVWRPVFANNQ